MTVRQWLEEKMDDARIDANNHEFASEVAKARYKTYLEVWNYLPVEQMEIQIAGETSAKEK
jgi:hypothetical protein